MSTSPVVRSGVLTPEGASTAIVGSVFVRTDGGAGTVLYVKETGSGNTGWVAYYRASGGTPANVLSTTNAAGTATTFLRTDDQLALFDATAVAAVGTSATGSAAIAARRDHVHATGAGTPSTQAFSDAAATGSGPAAAMTDHKHAWPALGTSAAAVGTSAGGSATTPSKSDHVHATGAGTPTTQLHGDAAATGSGPAASMTDHKHNIANLSGDVTTSGSMATTLATGSAGNLNSGTLLAARMPALTGDVTASAGSTATTLAAGSASNLNSGTLVAGRMPALTGDVTTSAGAVATTIANAAVTYAKIQNVSATKRLLGRISTGAGAPEEVTPLQSYMMALGANPFAPTGNIRETFPWTKAAATNSGAVLTSAKLAVVAIYLLSGEVIGHIGFWSGTTALNNGNNQWFALFNSTYQRLAVTSDDTSTAWAAHTYKSLVIANTAATPAGALSANSTYTVPSDGIYYLGILVKATTAVPSLSGLSSTTGSNPAPYAPAPGGSMAVLVAGADTALTDPTTCPTTATISGGLSGSYPWAHVAT